MTSGIATEGGADAAPTPAGAEPVTRSESADVPAWVVLLAIGGGALGGIVTQRFDLR